MRIISSLAIFLLFFDHHQQTSFFNFAFSATSKKPSLNIPDRVSINVPSIQNILYDKYDPDLLLLTLTNGTIFRLNSNLSSPIPVDALNLDFSRLPVSKCPSKRHKIKSQVCVYHARNTPIYIYQDSSACASESDSMHGPHQIILYDMNRKVEIIRFRFSDSLFIDLDMLLNELTGNLYFVNCRAPDEYSEGNSNKNYKAESSKSNSYKCYLGCVQRLNFYSMMQGTDFFGFKELELGDAPLNITYMALDESNNRVFLSLQNEIWIVDGESLDVLSKNPNPFPSLVFSQIVISPFGLLASLIEKDSLNSTEKKSYLQMYSITNGTCNVSLTFQSNVSLGIDYMDVVSMDLDPTKSKVHILASADTREASFIPAVNILELMDNEKLRRLNKLIVLDLSTKAHISFVDSVKFYPQKMTVRGKTAHDDLDFESITYIIGPNMETGQCEIQAKVAYL